MLPPDARSLLTDALRPPAGARLSRAVALTFTLDLESLLVAPLAFAAHGMRESSDPVTVMEAVHRCADRIDVFCQAGSIGVPVTNSKLLALLESVVHPVRRPKPGRIFHPKLWALRYVDMETGERSLRLVVLSRNLTKDRCWDACLTLDGHIGTRPFAVNRPIVDLIRHALGSSTQPIAGARRAAIDELTQDLRRAAWDTPDGFDPELQFHALGVAGGGLPDFSGSRHLVISPFVTQRGIQMSGAVPGSAIISRQEQLDSLPAGWLDDRSLFVLNESAGLEVDDDTAQLGLLTGLHAKVYVIEKGHRARVLVGSANATEAAFGGNVEFLVELTGSRNKVGIDRILDSAGGFRTVLEEYARRDLVEDDDQELALQEYVREIAAVPFTAFAAEDDGACTLTVTSDEPLPVKQGVRVSLRPITRPGTAQPCIMGERLAAAFSGLSQTDVTPFLVLTAELEGGIRERVVVVARLIGDSPGRLDQIMAEQVDTPEKFLRFLLLLLGLGGDISVLLAQRKGGGSGQWFEGSGSGIFELLMNALVDRPGQLDDLARMVGRMSSTEKGRAALPPGFVDLWRLIDEVRRDHVEANA